MITLDAYDRSARLATAYLVFPPAVVFVVALALGTAEWWSRIGGVLVACGAPMLAVQWGRSGGRRKQPDLFQLWEGSPTVRLLRFRTGGSPDAVSDRHAIVARATGRTLPTREEEFLDPAAADVRYDSAVAQLRELTRDEKKFPLVLKENIAYGFRRNLWGRKSYGVAVAVVTLVVCAGLGVDAAAGHRLLPWQAVLVPAAYAAAAFPRMDRCD